MEGDGVAEGVPDGAADADAAAEVVLLAVVDAACDALLAAWLLLVDDVQPAIDNEATITITIISAIISRFILIHLISCWWCRSMPPFLKTTLIRSSIVDRRLLHLFVTKLCVATLLYVWRCSGAGIEK
jgi:hypothetical protein